MQKLYNIFGYNFIKHCLTKVRCNMLKKQRYILETQFCWVFCGNVFQSVNLDTIDWLHTLNNIKRCLRYLRTSKIIRHYTLVQHFVVETNQT